MASEVIDIDVRLTLDKTEVDKEAESDEILETDVSAEGDSSGPLDKFVKKGETPKIDGDDIDSDAGLEKMLNTSKSGVNNLKGFASNPVQFVGGMMPNIAGTIPFIGLITAIIGIPEVIKKIVKFLTAKGSPFDRFLKIVSAEAQNAFFTRMEQRDRQLGKRQVIFTNVEGFSNRNGALTGNSFKNLGLDQRILSGSNIGTTRTASILDKAEGI